MNQLTTFIIDNFSTLCMVVAFLISIYIQHQIDEKAIAELGKRMDQLQSELDRNVHHLDEIKLDKTVFNQTMQQVSSMSIDIREIRTRLDDVLDKKFK